MFGALFFFSFSTVIKTSMVKDLNEKIGGVD
jgi:hypothetical protein